MESLVAQAYSTSELSEEKKTHKGSKDGNSWESIDEKSIIVAVKRR